MPELQIYNFNFQGGAPAGLLPKIASIEIKPSYAAISHSLCALMDRFEIPYDKPVVTYKTMLFAAWMKAVDNQFDENGVPPNTYYDLFKRPDLVSAKKDHQEGAAIDLISQMQDLNWHQNKDFLNILDRLVCKAEEQSRVTSIKPLIRMSARIASLSADAFLSIIKGDVELSVNFKQTYKAACVAAGILDTAIDLRRDCRDGIVKFEPTLQDQLLLYKVVCQYGLRTIGKYPQLATLIPMIAQEVATGIYRKSTDC